mmetsp:Transcript_72918/g.171445  ORF Transcript_72918/g.171445 Transcript_72918/m.171445 type:complete len:204 (-) Transcript_72918:34-645(-)
MKIVSIGIFRWKHSDASITEPVLLHGAYELSSFGFFQRGTVKEMATFFSRTCVKKTQPGGYQRLEHEGNFCYVVNKPSGIAGAMLADHEYPQRVAFSLLNKLLEDFSASCGGTLKQDKNDGCMPFPPLDEAIVKYQNPQEADKIMQIQRDLDETKEVLYNTIDSVLERGQKLDDLIDKSDDLSMQSKRFYKTAKKHNQCCKAY